jgi:hypothetical protein
LFFIYCTIHCIGGRLFNLYVTFPAQEKNIYDIITQNGMNDLTNEKVFGDLFGYFERIIKTEKNYAKKTA